ncbi:hypothetical protein C8Q69DRAFT_494883 [Paecilomyces variotii]|uniref:Uncharacterized protein n=1 Tax=Byssochlamys spectabilis TaxID=264951 RepID=A0A443I634_BYSSP|nr:hypothetical protein C8Q69DRAFT_494883 [Paecilomyces variotii]RWQ99548.1 hypothetical protein C8Q69DRAFT_494883 [Paecilomyces variotii]
MQLQQSQQKQSSNERIAHQESIKNDLRSRLLPDFPWHFEPKWPLTHAERITELDELSRYYEKTHHKDNIRAAKEYHALFPPTDLVPAQTIWFRDAITSRLGGDQQTADTPTGRIRPPLVIIEDDVEEPILNTPNTANSVLGDNNPADDSSTTTQNNNIVDGTTIQDNNIIVNDINNTITVNDAAIQDNIPGITDPTNNSTATNNSDTTLRSSDIVKRESPETTVIDLTTDEVVVKTEAPLLGTGSYQLQIL